MVICMAVNSKSDSRREGLSFYEFLRDENLSQQWLIKIKCRNIQSIMSECVILIVSAKITVGKKCHFSWPYIRLFATPHHPSPIG